MSCNHRCHNVDNANVDSIHSAQTEHLIQNKTSSSAVAKRPRDASCLSVVGFNSTIRRAQSFIVSYIGYRFITAYN